MKSANNSIFKGPKRTEILGIHFELGQIITHQKTGNEFKIMEIQAAGFICYLVKTLGKEIDNNQRFYISHGNIHEYR